MVSYGFTKNETTAGKVKPSYVDKYYFTLPLHLGHPALLRHLLYT